MVDCPNCQARYRISDKLAGRRVKCRRCGAVVDVPEVCAPTQDGADPDPPPAAAAGGADTRPPAAADTRRGATIRSRDTEVVDIGDADESTHGLRMNTPFSFRFASELDQATPWLAAVLCVAWIVTSIVRHAAGREPWMGPMRAALAILGYVGIVFPVSLAGLHMGMTRVKVGLPHAHRLRSFAVFIVPFTFGYAPWIVTGDSADLVTGIVFGLGIGLGLIWLLFRLHAEESPIVLGYAGVAFVLATGLCIGVFSFLNAGFVAVGKAMHVQHPLSGSPFGGHFAWLPEAPPPVIAPRPSPLPLVERPPDDSVTTLVPQPTTLPRVNPALLKSLSPLVAEVRSPLAEPFDDVVYPAVPGPWAAILRHTSPEEDRIELWHTGDWQQKAGVRLKHEPSTKDHYIISPNGDYLVRIVTWPRLAAQVWSFTSNQVLRNIDWRGRNETPSLLGFISNDAFIVQWAGEDRSWSLEQWEAGSGSIRGQLTKTLPLYDRSGVSMALSPNGMHLAVATRSADADGAVAGVILEYQLDLPQETPTRTLPISALDPKWPVKPTGMAFSPDSSKIAVLFEQNDNALLLCWRLADSRQIAEYVYPASPISDPASRAFTATVLDWLGGDAWLLCGQVLIDAAANQNLGTLDLRVNDLRQDRPSVFAQRVVDAQTCELVYDAGAGKRQLAVLKVRTTPHEEPRRGPATRP
ncbi:MAG: MJ0042-type zinc finger domain-containing protein [Tepidisphaeraceae bacterium]